MTSDLSPAGRTSKVPLQPLALDMTSGEPAEHSKLARLLTNLKSREKGRADPEMAPIRGLAGEDAANKVGVLAFEAGQWGSA